jgi:hypothetical protein
MEINWAFNGLIFMIVVGAGCLEWGEIRTPGLAESKGQQRTGK